VCNRVFKQGSRAQMQGVWGGQVKRNNVSKPSSLRTTNKRLPEKSWLNRKCGDVIFGIEISTHPSFTYSYIHDFISLAVCSKSYFEKKRCAGGSVHGRKGLRTFDIGGWRNLNILHPGRLSSCECFREYEYFASKISDDAFTFPCHMLSLSTVNIVSPSLEQLTHLPP